jgi:hypothetical protein
VGRCGFWWRPWSESPPQVRGFCIPLDFFCDNASLAAAASRLKSPIYGAPIARRTPSLSFSQRLIGSVRRECLDPIVVFDEKSCAPHAEYALDFGWQSKSRRRRMFAAAIPLKHFYQSDKIYILQEPMRTILTTFNVFWMSRGSSLNKSERNCGRARKEDIGSGSYSPKSQRSRLRPRAPRPKGVSPIRSVT